MAGVGARKPPVVPVPGGAPDAGQETTPPQGTPVARLRRIDTPMAAASVGRTFDGAAGGLDGGAQGAAGGGGVAAGAAAPPRHRRSSSGYAFPLLGSMARMGRGSMGKTTRMTPNKWSFDDLATKVYGDAARAPMQGPGAVGSSVGSVGSSGGAGAGGGGGGANGSAGVGGSVAAPRQRTWLVFESSGAVRKYSAEKHRLVRRLAVPARDLRVLDPASHTPAAILCREKALVVNLGFIRMVLCADEAYLLYSGFDQLQSRQVRAFAERLRVQLEARAEVSHPAVAGANRDSGYASDGDLSAGRGGRRFGGYSSDASDVSASPAKQVRKSSEPDCDQLSPGDDGGIEAELLLGSAALGAMGGHDGRAGDGGDSGRDSEMSKFGGGLFRQRQQNFFEFRVLESALERVVSDLENETDELERLAYPALDQLTYDVTSSNLDSVRKIKGKMNRLHNRATQFRDELEQLLANDDDMNEMYLTRKLVAEADEPLSTPFGDGDERFGGSDSEEEGSVRGGVGGSGRGGASAQRLLHEGKLQQQPQQVYDVEEIEDLLETYNEQVLACVYKLSTLREYIDDTEDYIAIMQDSHRNRLIQMDLMISCGTFCLTVTAVVASLFGMNIPNPLGGLLNGDDEDCAFARARSRQLRAQPRCGACWHAWCPTSSCALLTGAHFASDTTGPAMHAHMDVQTHVGTPSRGPSLR